MFNYNDIEKLSKFASGAKVALTREQQQNLLDDGWEKKDGFLEKDGLRIKRIPISVESTGSTPDEMHSEIPPEQTETTEDTTEENTGNNDEGNKNLNEE